MKAVIFALAMLALIAAAIIVLPQAKAQPGCTWDNPSPPPGSVCIGASGSGRSCNVKMPSCSPVPNTPGTWNPSGYTPKVG